jgi:monovalent cation/hydrogen antiporter
VADEDYLPAEHPTSPRSLKSSGYWRDWRRELLAAEREAILSLRDEGKISPEVMRRIERDLDVQESRLGG